MGLFRVSDYKRFIEMEAKFSLLSSFHSCLRSDWQQVAALTCYYQLVNLFKKKKCFTYENIIELVVKLGIQLAH